MRLIETTPGKTYAVTTPGACQVKYELQSGDVVTVLDATSAGQYYFVAIGLHPEVTNDNAALTECFSAALFGSSAGGGGISPVQPGLTYQASLPDDGMLQPDTVYDLGTLTAAAYLTNLWLNYADRIVSCELWMAFGSSVPVIAFPASWVWIGGLPGISTPNTACRIVIRREPSRTVANLAYSA